MLTTWITVFLAAGLPIGGFMGFMAQSVIESKIGKVIAVITTITLVTSLVVLITTNQARDWNDGFCPNCGIHWELRAVTPRRSKIYVCPQCYREICR